MEVLIEERFKEANMAITGKRIMPEQIIHASEKDEKVCDICGADATDRSPCQKCKKDLCSKHQLDVYRVQTAEYQVGKELSGLFCKECLIAEINERY